MVFPQVTYGCVPGETGRVILHHVFPEPGLLRRVELRVPACVVDGGAGAGTVGLLERNGGGGSFGHGGVLCRYICIVAGVFK